MVCRKWGRRLRRLVAGMNRVLIVLVAPEVEVALAADESPLAVRATLEVLALA